MNFCPNCGKEQKQKALFCSNCGTALQEETANETQAAVGITTQELTPQNTPEVTQEDTSQDTPQNTPEVTQEDTPQSTTPSPSHEVGSNEQDSDNELASLAPVQDEITPASLQAETAVGLVNERSRFPKLFSKLTISVAIGVIAISAIALFAYQMLANKTPKQLYLLSEWNTAQLQSDSIATSFASELALQQMIKTNPHTTKAELGIDVTFTGAEEFEGFTKFRDVLKDSKLSIEAVNDPVKKFGKFTLAYLLRDESIIDATILHDEENFGLEVPVLFDERLYIKESEFNEFIDDKSSDTEVAEQPTWQEYMDIFTLTDEQLERINEDYTQFILDNLKEEYFTLTKDVAYTSPDGVKQVSQIDITLTEDEIQKLFLNLIDQVRADKELHKIVAQKVVDFAILSNRAQPYSNVSSYSEALTDVDYVIEQIEDGLYEMRGDLDDQEFPEGFQMTVLIDNKERIVDRKVEFEFEQNTTNTGIAVKFQASKWVSKDDMETGTIDLELSSTRGSSGEIEFHSETSGTNTKLGKKKDTKSSFRVEDSGLETLDIGFDLTAFQAAGNKEGQENTEYEFELRMGGEELNELGLEVKGNLKRSVDQKLDDDYSKQNYVLELIIAGDNPLDGDREEIGIKLDFNNEVVFSDEVPLKDSAVINDQAVNASKMTDEEWEEFRIKVYESLEKFIEENEDLFELPGMFY